ncbi:MarR family winged helix-turn-helix transcriptional regulator [Embleya sp. NPDC055664]
MTTTASPVTPRALALAHYAGRALLERVLARHGVTFHQGVTLRVVAVADGAVGRDELVGEVTGSLKEPESVVRGVVEELVAAKLVEADPADAARLRLTGAGRTLYDTTTAETAGISARVYADIAPEDLAVAGRVLALITEHANAELARV